MKRWTVRILVVIACLLLIAAAGVQVVLWSDLPRRLVIAELQEKTGLEIAARDVKTGWFGSTTLTEATFGLPLADQRILSAPRIDVKHTSILMMLLGRGVDIHELQLPHPTLHLYRDANGAWNAARAVESLRRAAQRETQRSGPTIPKLPRVEIRDANVRIERFGGDVFDAPALQLKGEPRSALVWAFEGQMPGLVRFDGRLAPGGSWEHAVDFNLDAPIELVELISNGAAGNVSAQGEWRGEMRKDALAGRFDLRRLESNAMSLSGSGSLTISADDALRIALNDPQLQIRLNEFADEALRVGGGELEWKGQLLEARRLQVQMLQADAVIDGQWNLSTRSGQAHAAWRGVAARHNAQHRGTIEASVQSPHVGDRAVNLQISSHAETNERAAHVQMNVSASGPVWREMSGAIEFTNIELRGPDEFQLAGVSASATMAWPALRLTNVRVPNAQTTLEAQVNAKSLAWSIEGVIENWQSTDVPPLFQQAKFQLRANGDPDRTELSELVLNHNAANLTAAGQYLHATHAIQGRVTVRGHASAITNDAAAQHPLFRSARALENPRGELTVTGSVEPLNLHVIGELGAESFALGNARVDSLRVPVTGRVQPDQTTFVAAPVALFGGQITVTGALVEGGTTLETKVEAHQISLRELAAALQLPIELQGKLAAQTQLRVPVQNWKAMQARGTWQIDEARYERESIDHGEGKLSASNGELRLSDVRLTRGAASIAGDATVPLHSTSMSANISVEQWPVEFRGIDATLTVDGQSNLAINFGTKSVNGAARLTASGTWRDIAFGPAQLHLEADGDSIHLRQLHAEFLGGALRGTGSAPLADWRQAHATISCSNLPLQSLAHFNDQLTRLDGSANAMVTVQPSSDARAVGPTLVEVIVQSNQARFGEIHLGNVYAVAYPTPERIIVDRCEIELADGSIHAWGRTSLHDGDQFIYGTATFDQLNLDQIARTIDPTLERVPGLLSGTASAGGYLRRPHRLFGQAKAELAESDLANVPAVSLIYDALNLNLGGPQAAGEGRAHIRLEGDALDLSRLEYFNRGADIVARVRIADIWRGGESPIDGLAVGAMRPLKNIDLPFFSDFDRALEALQSGAASVRISGTVNQRETKLVPFAEISGAFMRVLTGSAD